MKAKAIREKSVDDIQSDLKEARKKLIDLKVKEAAKNAGRAPVGVRSLRKDIARMMTVLKEKA